MRFVSDGLDATTHHVDLRLEHDGTSWSWALSTGLPARPAGGSAGGWNRVADGREILEAVEVIDPYGRRAEGPAPCSEPMRG